MPTITLQRARALALLGRQPILRLKDFTVQEVGPETLARLVREGITARVAGGLYQRANASPDARHSLAEATVPVPKGVVCLINSTNSRCRCPRRFGWKLIAWRGVPN